MKHDARVIIKGSPQHQGQGAQSRESGRVIPSPEQSLWREGEAIGFPMLSSWVRQDSAREVPDGCLERSTLPKHCPGAGWDRAVAGSVFVLAVLNASLAE
jgi:hypothetical protein